MEKTYIKLNENIDCFSLCILLKDMLTYFKHIKGIISLNGQTCNLVCDGSGKIEVSSTDLKCSDDLINLLFIECENKELCSFLIDKFKIKYQKLFAC